MSILPGIFAACYTIALALAVAGLFYRGGVRGTGVLAFAGLAVILHGLFLIRRAVTATSTPLSSPYDWYLLGAWALAVVFIYLSWYQPRIGVGLFLLPLVLGLIGVSQFASQQPFPQSYAGQVWGPIHGLFLLLGLVAVAIGFVVGVMYLIQSYRLKNKLPAATSVRLPSLEWLERANSRAILISVLMVGIGFASGIILNMVSHQRKIDEVPWTDPIIWQTALMFAWLLAAAVFSALYRPARSGRKVAYLTVASFVVLVVSLGFRFVVPSEHGTTPPRNAEVGVRTNEKQVVDHNHSALPISRSALRQELLA